MYLQEPKLSGILIIDVRALDLWASGLRQALARHITSAFWLMKVRLSCQQIVRESCISHLSQFTLQLVVDKSAQEYNTVKTIMIGNILFYIIWISFSIDRFLLLHIYGLDGLLQLTSFLRQMTSGGKQNSMLQTRQKEHCAKNRKL